MTHDNFQLSTSNFIMSSIFNLPLTTSEAYDLKNFIRKHTKHLAGKIDLTGEERCIAFISDRIPDVQIGQQTFAFPPETKENHNDADDLFSLCYDIIQTASPSNIERETYNLSVAYSIIDPSTKKDILRAIRFRPYFSTHPQYSVYLYDSLLHMQPLLTIEVYNTLFEACEKIIAKKDREKEKAEQEKRSELLTANIQKAKQYLTSHNTQH